VSQIYSNSTIASVSSTQSLSTDYQAIAFIDPAVEDHQTLMAGLVPGTQAILLDSQRDGIEQISETLQNYSQLQSVHIIAHGSPGCVYLGNSVLNQNTLSRYQEQLQGWQSALAEDADILLYGCRVAGVTSHISLLEDLAAFTQANIAASTSITGNAAQGGNWNLEVQVGNVTSQLALTAASQQNYAGILDPTISNSSIFTNNSGTLAIGDELEIIVDADENLEDGGDDPVIALDIGGTGRTATFDSINSNGNAVFKYTIQNGDNDSDGIQVSGLTVNDLRGASSGAPLDASGFTFSEDLGVDADGTPPTIDDSSVSTAATGTKNAGATITITVDASEDLVKGSGTPTLDLSIGSVTRTADFDSIASGDAEFTYEVQNGDEGTIEVTAVNPGTDGLEDDNGNDLDTSSFTGQSLGVDASTPPVINDITTSDSGTLSGGDLTITVDANEDLSVGVTNPELELKDLNGDGNPETATFDSIDSGNAVFKYTVQAGDNDSDGVEVSDIIVGGLGDTASPINNLDKSGFSFPENLGVNIDNTKPTINSVTSNQANSTLGESGEITITVEADEELSVSGTNPELELDVGSTNKTATYDASSSSGKEAVFTYTVQAGDSDSDGIQVTDINVNGLADAAGNTLDKGTFFTPPKNIDVNVDTDPPTITSIDSAQNGSTLAVGDTLKITVDASEDLEKGSGNPALELTFSDSNTVRNATFDSINSGNAVFTYDIQDGDNDSDGIEVTFVTQSGLEDVPGNDLDPSTVTLPQNIGVEADTKAPTISSISSTPNSGTLEVDDTLSIKVDADEDLSEGSGTPQLTLDVGGTDRTANFDSIDSNNDALFTYTIQSGDNDSDGIAVKSVTAGGLQDDVGNELDPSTASVDLGVNVDTAPVINSITASPSSGTLSKDEELEITVDANESLQDPGNANPTLTLNFSDSNTTGTADFKEIDSSGNAVFTYTVTGDDEDTDGIQVTAYNAGTDAQLEDDTGKKVITDITNITGSNNLGVNADGRAPTSDGEITSSLDFININNQSNFSFQLNGVSQDVTQITFVLEDEQGNTLENQEIPIGNVSNISLSNDGTLSVSDINLENADPALVDGELDLSVTLTDDAGNTSEAITQTFTKDSEVPAANDITSELDTVNQDNQSNFSFQLTSVSPDVTQIGYTITGSQGETVELDPVAIDSDSNISFSDGTITVGNVDVSNLADGDLSLSVTLTDNAGNTSEAITQTFTKDTAAADDGADGGTGGGDTADGGDTGGTGGGDTADGGDTGGTINTPPEINNVDIERSVSADGQIQLGVDVFAETFSDPEGSSLSAIRINDLPENGTLLLGSETVSSGQIISASELNSLVLEPDAGFTGSISFSWNASDGERFSLFNKNLEIDVQAAEEQPDEDDDDDGIGDGDDGGDVPEEVPDVGDDVGDDDDDDDDDDDIDNEVVGSEDDDTLEGGNGNDDVSAGGGNDGVAVFSGNDNVRGDAGNDFIFGNQGDDNLDGGDGDDVIFGGQQNDNVQGGNGNDLLNGDLGDDVIGGGNDNDLISGGQGNDNANGDDGDDLISGGQGEDALNGNNGNDTIFGGQQADIINGGNGDDFLSGDLQEDTLTGGEGSDRFLLRAVSGPDIITDFEDGVDSLVLPTSDFPVQPAGLSFEDLSVFQAEGGTVISFNGNAIAGLTGVDATTITEDDFQDVSSL
jgi:hypothetical protein